LKISKFGIQPSTGTQLQMGALLDQASSAKHQNPISSFNRGKSVGNDHGGAAVEETI
jgi:hypothetical protein